MDLLLQVQYKKKNNFDVEILRVANTLINTVMKKRYMRLRKLSNISGTIGMIAILYLMWYMWFMLPTIMVLLVGIVGIYITIYIMLSFKKRFIKRISKIYSQGQLSKTPRAFILDFYEDSIELKFDEENSIRRVYSLVGEIYETTDMFYISNITWIFKSQLSKEDIVAIKNILKTQVTDKYIEFN